MPGQGSGGGQAGQALTVRWVKAGVRTSDEARAEAKAPRRGSTCWGGGGGRGTGRAVNRPPGPGPTASGWAFSRTRGSASQAVRLHPWGLSCNIHVARKGPVPLPPPPPLTDDRRPRQTRVLPGSARQLLFPWQRHTVERWVGAGFWGCEPHGCGDQAYKDVFTASPTDPPRPALARATLHMGCSPKCVKQPGRARLYAGLAASAVRQAVMALAGAATQSRTGAKLWRWCGQGPWVRRAARWAGVP